MQVAICTYAVNSSLYALKVKNSLATAISLDFIKEIIFLLTDPEATFRLLVALGTIGVAVGADCITDRINNFLKEVANWDMSDPIRSKAAICAKRLLKNVS